jgi:Arc/MetJ-type ribon-helix-helix transcriptional regulator
MTRSETTARKIAVSLRPELVEHASRAVAEGRAPSVSAFVADAIESVIRREALAAAIADYEAEFGEITASEREATAIAGVLRRAEAAANAPKRRSAKKKERKQASKAS